MKSPPLKIILSSGSTDVFSEIMIGINCKDNVSFDEIGGKEETRTSDLDFKIEMTVLPILLATCPENENCVDLDVNISSPLHDVMINEQPEWWEKIEVMVGISGTIIGLIVGIITISEKLKRNKSQK